MGGKRQLGYRVEQFGLYHLFWFWRKPQCVKYDFSEEKESSDGEKYYNLECCYLDLDGEKFGEDSIQIQIPKFLGTKRIDALEAFPLTYLFSCRRNSGLVTAKGALRNATEIEVPHGPSDLDRFLPRLQKEAV